MRWLFIAMLFLVVFDHGGRIATLEADTSKLRSQVFDLRLSAPAK